MKSAAVRTIDVLVVVGTTAYAITGLCCVYMMWRLRRQFFIALRSPLLGCLIGATTTLRSWAGSCYLLTLYDWHYEGENEATIRLAGAFRIIFSPASLVSIGALIAWVVRLLVMYDPLKRRRWGRYTNEKRLFRGLIWTFVLLETGACVSGAVNGLAWAATNLFLIDAAGTVLTLAAAVLLTGRLRKIHDICQLSWDTQCIGMLMVGIILIFVALLLLPMPRLLVKYTAISLSILPLFTVFITNMKPVRDYLRQHDHGSRRDLPTLLWRRLTGGESPGAHSIISLGRVACTTSHEDHKSLASIRSGIGSTAKGHLHETPLAAVMGFLPVQQAFGEYCRKALCSESFQFLLDVSEFESSLSKTRHAGVESCVKDDGGFDEFSAIVNEYIRDKSRSEINIDGATKKKILKFCDRSAYTSLSLEARGSILLQAEREVAKMLAENLLNKFKATEEYKELAGDMVFDSD